MTSSLTQFDWISNHGPSFVLPAANFDVLDEPCDFFEQLKRMITDAKDRIYISSLYFGTDAHEHALVGNRDAYETSCM